MFLELELTMTIRMIIIKPFFKISFKSFNYECDQQTNLQTLHLFQDPHFI